MALNKEFQNERGDVVGYWKIVRRELKDMEHKANVILYGFKNEEDRQAHLQNPLMTKQLDLDIVEGQREELYNAIKTLDGWEETKDC